MEGLVIKSKFRVLRQVVDWAVDAVGAVCYIGSYSIIEINE